MTRAGSFDHLLHTSDIPAEGIDRGKPIARRKGDDPLALGLEIPAQVIARVDEAID